MATLLEKLSENIDQLIKGLDAMRAENERFQALLASYPQSDPPILTQQQQQQPKQLPKKKRSREKRNRREKKKEKARVQAQRVTIAQEVEQSYGARGGEAFGISEMYV